MKVPLYTGAGEKRSEIDVSDVLFGVPANTSVVHAAVVRHLARGRQGTADTKTRGEVSGGGRKPWRQKGTGRARHGSIRSPIWRGGGVAFGPTPRKYNPGLPAKVRRLALKVALSSKARQGQVVVLEELQLEQPKTAVLARLLRQVVGSETALVVIAEPDRNIGLAARNLPGVRVLVARNINVYDVVKHGRVLLTQQALARLEEAFVT